DRHRHRDKGSQSTGSRVEGSSGDLALVVDVLRVDQHTIEAGFYHIVQVYGIIAVPDCRETIAVYRARDSYDLTSLVDPVCLAVNVSGHRQRLERMDAPLLSPDKGAQHVAGQIVGISAGKPHDVALLIDSHGCVPQLYSEVADVHDFAVVP